MTMMTMMIVMMTTTIVTTTNTRIQGKVPRAVAPFFKS